MNTFVSRLSTVILTVSALLMSLSVAAETAEPAGPKELIEAATKEIVVAIEDAKGYFSEEPERFHAEVDRILFPIIDFKSFARSVMGRHGSRKYEASLASDAEKEQFQQQVTAFTGKFKQGLVATYSKGLLTFQGERIDVKMPKPAKGKNAFVIQEIHNGGAKPVLIRYKLRQNSDGEWKVRNVQLQSINLGKVYRNQFASAAKQYKGDIDQVIANWVVVSQEVEE